MRTPAHGGRRESEPASPARPSRLRLPRAYGPPGVSGSALLERGYAASGASSTMSRVRVGSTFTPGPIVEASVIEWMYLPFADGRLRADELLDHRRVVLEQPRSSKLDLPITRWTIAVRSVRYSTLPAFDSSTALLDVHRDRADLRVRHLARRAEDAAEPADDGHQVRRRDRDVEVVEALLDAAWRGPPRRRRRRRPPRPRAPCRPGRRRRS